MAQRDLEADALDQLEGDQLRPARLASREQRERLFGRGHGAQRRLAHRERGVEAQARRGDQAERALGADEQVAQRVAAVVLADAAQVVEHTAVGQHDLEAEHELARVAVADRADAARVGADRAADGRRALRAEGEREEPARPRRRLLHGLHRAPRLGHQRHSGCVHPADAVHALERDDHRGRPLRERRRPAREAGAPARGHHGEAEPGAAAQARRGLLGRAGAQHRDGRPLVGAAPVHGVGRDLVLAAQHVRGREEVREAVERAHFPHIVAPAGGASSAGDDRAAKRRYGAAAVAKGPRHAPVHRSRGAGAPAGTPRRLRARRARGDHARRPRGRRARAAAVEDDAGRVHRLDRERAG